MGETVVDATLPPLGFISLDIHFHRPPGDPYNEETWPFPIIREQAEGSTESVVVTGQEYDEAFIARFVEAGQKLAAKGCVGIVTSCGFLAMAQPELADRLPIPIATSALIQVPSILSLLAPSKSIGIVTYDDQRLNTQHLEKLSVPASAFSRIHIRGAPADGHLRAVITGRKPYVHADIKAELTATAKGLVADHPTIRAVVLECTQMPPFAEAIQQALGNEVVVYDVYTMALWFYSGLRRKSPAAWKE